MKRGYNDFEGVEGESIEQGRLYLRHAIEDLLGDELLSIEMSSETETIHDGPCVRIDSVTKTFDVISKDRKTATIQITQEY